MDAAEKVVCNRATLLRAERLSAIGHTRGYRTISGVVALVLTEMLPVDLLTFKRRSVNIFRGKASPIKEAINYRVRTLEYLVFCEFLWVGWESSKLFIKREYKIFLNIRCSRGGSNTHTPPSAVTVKYI